MPNAKFPLFHRWRFGAQEVLEPSETFEADVVHPSRMVRMLIRVIANTQPIDALGAIGNIDKLPARTEWCTQEGVVMVKAPQ
jgi:hypothetical protein